MNDLAAELRYRREQRLVAQEMAMDATPGSNRQLELYKQALAARKQELTQSSMPREQWVKSSAYKDIQDDIRELEWKIKNYNKVTGDQAVASTAASSGTPNMGRVIGKDAAQKFKVGDKVKVRGWEGKSYTGSDVYTIREISSPGEYFLTDAKGNPASLTSVPESKLYRA